MTTQQNNIIQKKKVAIYLRLSTEDQVEQYGSDLQLDKILSYLNVRSEYLELISEDYIFFDSGVSGAFDVELRPQLRKLFEVLEYSPEGEKPFDLVIVYKIDRFARKLSVLLDIVDRFKKYNVGFISCTESIDTDTPFGNAMLGILGVFAELERSLIQERTFGGRNEAVKQGEWMNDKYGYKRVSNLPEIFDEEANVVRMIFDLFVNKHFTVAQIARELREKKVLIPTASKTTNKSNANNRMMHNVYKWGDKKIRQILTDEIYIGVYYFNKSKSIKDLKSGKKKVIELPKSERLKSEVEHMPIIDINLFERAQELLENKGGNTNQKEGSDYLLSGLLKCGCCQHMRRDQKALTIKGIAGGGKHYYQCNGKNSQKFEGRRCRLVPLPKNELEDFVIFYVKDFIGNPVHFHSFVEKYKSKGISSDAIEKQMQQIYSDKQKLTKKMDNIQDMYANGEIDKLKYDKYKIDNHNQKGNLDAKLIDLRRTFDKQANDNKYYEGLKIMHNMIGEKLGLLFENRKLLRQFLSYIISEIYVYGRDATENDYITGRKTAEGIIQEIPEYIDIHMRLPQDILNSIYTELRKDNWYNYSEEELPDGAKIYSKFDPTDVQKIDVADLNDVLLEQ